MMKLPEKMTTEELAEFLGVRKQTVNRWIREKKWTTEMLAGVKGGRARLIHINKPVLEFIMQTSMMRERQSQHSLAEPAAPYDRHNSSPAFIQICNVLQNLTPSEEQRLKAFLMREGLRGLTERLNIADPKE